MSPVTRATVTLAAFVNAGAPVQASGVGLQGGLSRLGVNVSLVLACPVFIP